MDKKQLTPEQIRIAVDWWKKAIDHPKFDNGDNSEAGGLTTMYALLAASKHDPSPATVDRFGVALAKIMADPDKVNEWRGLSVDYGPDHVLSEAAEAANVDHSRFPWKTRMRFQSGGVQVSAGYGAEYVDLLAAADPTP